MDAFGGCPEGLAWGMNPPEDGQSGVRQGGERFGQAGPLGVVAIFVPPAVFDEVEAVFHLPVATNVCLEFTGRDRIGVQAAHEVPAFAGKEHPFRGTYFAINTQRDSATGNVQMLPYVVSIIEVDPKPPRFLVKPLFSVTSWAGRTGDVWKKQVSRASNMSGWFAFTWKR